MKTVKAKKIQLVKESTKFTDYYHVKLDEKEVYSSEYYPEAVSAYEMLRDKHSTGRRKRIMIEEEL